MGLQTTTVLKRHTGSSSLARFCIHAACLLLALPAFAATPAAVDIPALLDQPVEPRGTGSCPAPDRFFLARPDPPGTPTIVGLAVLFQDVSALNDVDQTITADVYLIQRWLDPRLADPGRG